MKQVLSLGAGVQSSVVLLMSCKGELPKLDAAVFADTGWEPAAVHAWFEAVLVPEAEKAGIPLHVVRATEGGIREDTLRHIHPDTEGRNGTIPFYTKRGKQETGGAKKRSGLGQRRRSCTKVYKIQPLERKIREIAGLKKYQRWKGKTPAVEQWFGISLDEVQRMRDSQHNWCSYRYPLLYDVPLTRQGCVAWIEKNGYPLAPKSACIGCPYRSREMWARLKEVPAEWADAVAFDKAIRKVRGFEGECFVNEHRVPLDEVDLESEFDKGQLSLFGSQCDGMCGV